MLHTEGQDVGCSILGSVLEVQSLDVLIVGDEQSQREVFSYPFSTNGLDHCLVQARLIYVSLIRGVYQNA